MSLVEQLHAARKERLNRMSPAAKPEAPAHDVRIDELAAEVARLSGQLSDLQELVEQQSGRLALLSKQMAEVNPYLSEIMDAVCEFYGITKNDLCATRRTWNMSKPRQIVAYLSRKLTGMSLPQIGARMGGRDHSTILHGANKISRDMQRDDVLRDDLATLEMKIAEKVISRQQPLRGKA
jgi:chromosomal replication initiation ATPase DnaA